jgi:hypothetical protein
MNLIKTHQKLDGLFVSFRLQAHASRNAWNERENGFRTNKVKQSFTFAVVGCL